MDRLRINARPLNPLRHDAVRDTHWVGKGLGNHMLLVGFLIVVAAAAALLLPA